MLNEDLIEMGLENNIPEGWVETTIGDIADVKGGKRMPKGSVLIGEKTNHPYIRITDFEGNSIDKKNLLYVPDNVFDKISRYIVNSGDVIISIVGTIGLIGRIDKDLDNASLTENCVKLVNLINVIPNYLFYYLSSRIGQYEIIKNTVGAVQKKLPIYGVQSIKIKLPHLPEQKAIAKVLTTFDDKIELLQSQNKTLETMAQTIFKERFGKYQIGDELPEDWRIGELRDLGDIICGKTPSKADKENFGGNIPFIKIPDMHNQMFIIKTSDSLTKKGSSTQKNKLIPKNSICVSCIATVGLVSITSKDSQTNQQINSIIPFNDTYREFLYFKVKGLYKYLQDIGSGGTATLNVNTTSFSNIEIIIPDYKKLNAFNIIVSPIFDKVFENYNQIQFLTKTRDTLLPKLMSGQVRVKNLKQPADA